MVKHKKTRRKKRVLISFGTRPEALKFVPLIRALKRSPDFECLVSITGQHRQMLDQVINFFRVKVDVDMRLMRVNQSLEYVSGRILQQFGKVMKETRPDIVFVQGDTASALMAGIAGFYAKKKIGHLEAGLRTWNKYEPFPEEMNRVLLSRLANFHFTPTRQATQNLVKEGVPKRDIFQIGNTIVDTVNLAKPLVRKTYPIFRGLDCGKRILFVTAHRRESFGNGLFDIFTALKRIAQRFKDVEIVYPVHLNPNVAEPAFKVLSGIERIRLCRPLTYEETCWIMSHCYAILTDSGGIQEEAPCFNKPVLVLRNVTERMEGVRVGVAQLVGTDTDKIFNAAGKLLTSLAVYKRMSSGRNPYGDGRSSERVIEILRAHLKVD